MRISVINQLYAPASVGGAEKSVQQLCETLVNAGHDVSVLTTRVGDAPRYETINGVKISRIKPRNLYTFGDKGGDKRNALSRLAWHIIDADNISMRPVVSKWLVDSRVEVVHTNNLAGISVAAWSAAFALGVPIVHTLRDYYLFCSRSTLFRNGSNCGSRCHACRALAWPKTRAAAHVAGVVGISNFVLNSHLDAGLFPNASVQTVIPNSVHVVDSTREKTDTLRDKPLTLGFLGQLTEEKGIRWFLKTLNRAKFLDNCRLRIGGALDTSYARSLVREFGNDRVTFDGFVNAQEFLGKVGLLVVPSLWNEPFGRVVIEAAAMGVPALVSNRGGLPETVDNGRTGFVFDPDKPTELVGLLSRLASNHEFLRRCGDIAKARVQNYSPNCVAAEYESIYLNSK